MTSSDELLADAGRVEEALSYARDRQFADLIALVVGLAARRHPEVLRKALADVYDLSAVEAQTRRAVAGMQEALDRAAEARELLGAVEKQIADVETRLGKIESWCEWLERTYRQGYAAMREYIQKFRRTVDAVRVGGKS